MEQRRGEVKTAFWLERQMYISSDDDGSFSNQRIQHSSIPYSIVSTDPKTETAHPRDPSRVLASSMDAAAELFKKIYSSTTNN